MTKTYDPKSIEQKWYQTWEKAGYFNPTAEGKPYSITLPPPNVTGTLHMGHGFQVTLMDALIRYHRMQGKKVHWQAGTDHAGIATQMVVERELAKENISRQQLGREAFIQKVWEWKKHSGETIKKQLRRMGASLNWDTEKFTMDKEVCKAVRKVFIQLFDEGLIYRDKHLVNWDPKFRTAISDLEVVIEEQKGELWHIRYPLVESHDYLVVATSRPETLFGDTAVAVNIKDSRYKKLVGKKVRVPLCDRNVPIIADDYVEIEFGTGVVKITPAHDFNDYAVGKRHKLPIINILTEEAHLNQEVPKPFQGLERFEARKKIVEILKAENLIEKIEPYTLQVPKGDRSGAVIEPYLTSQWFIKMKPLAKPAKRALKEKHFEFIPENWGKTYVRWLDNIEDWCISRQLWWGHRIPAWYDEKNNIYVGEDETSVREKYKLDNKIKLKQDEDVLDTWFSSALWPFTTLGWPENTNALKTFYPNSVLVTGFDIIFFWVARMVMMGLKFKKQVPFYQVYITGLIRDHEGQKMSKSKGNILDPLDIIDGIDLEHLIKKRTSSLMLSKFAKKVEEATRKEFPNGIKAYGTDALRFTYCALATTGRDIRFDMNRVEGYRNFCNKIWNAARYVLMHLNDQKVENKKPKKLHVIDMWIRSKLHQTIEKVRKHFENYRFDMAAQTIYEFIWNEYCDWYLELTKPILTGEASKEEKLATKQTLLYVLETTLRLLHPLMPFITEEIWQKVAPLLNIKGNSIMVQPYPNYEKSDIDKKALEETEWLKAVVLCIRNIRGEMNISPGKQLPLLLKKGTQQDKERIKAHETFLKTLAKLESIQWIDSQSKLELTATGFVGELELVIPLNDLIDKSAETARLTKEIKKLEKELTFNQNKLNNPNFVKKAPKTVVEKTHAIIQETQSTLTKLQKQLDRIKE